MADIEKFKPVVMRKNILVVAAGLVGIILMITVYNLFHASDHKTQASSNETSKVERMASGQEIENLDKQNRKPQSAFASLPPPPQKNSEDTKKEDAKNSHGTDGLEKAMSAAINSNQLLGDTADNAQTATQAKKEPTYLASSVKEPLSPYTLHAGNIIPAILITGIQSDLPGQMTAQVKANIYDSINGQHLLIPQGSKLIGTYDANIAYGQDRVGIIWQRIIFPNGQSLDLSGMLGADIEGYSGFKDKVDHHYGSMVKTALLLSVFNTGAQINQPVNSSNATGIQQALAQNVGMNLANTGSEIINKQVNIQPSITIQPGYEFNVMITKDLVFPKPYSDHL
jgi:type IV secretion system protein VirB10